MKSGSITLSYMALSHLVLKKYCSKAKSNSMSCKLDNLLGREFALINEFLLPKLSTFCYSLNQKFLQPLRIIGVITYWRKYWGISPLCLK